MITISPRETLDRRLSRLQQGVLILGSMVEQATMDAVKALKHRDLTNAVRIYADDRWINEKRFEIENESLITIATQQPTARDLRILASILDIISELERMGDYAKGIARVAILLGDYPPLPSLDQIPAMAEKTVDMLHRSLDAFIARDAEAARAIPDEDDAVDVLYNQAHRELLSWMMKNRDVVDPANHTLWAAHNLERMADRVTNICERILFVATGELIELDVSDDELRSR